jgi:hypothetical protein
LKLADQHATGRRPLAIEGAGSFQSARASLPSMPSRHAVASRTSRIRRRFAWKVPKLETSSATAASSARAASSTTTR